VAQLHDLTALEQSSAIKRGEIACADLTRHYLQRIQEHDRTVGAFITVLPEAAIERAAKLDRELARTPDITALSPLFGAVVPVKDLDMVSGVRCTFGSKAYRDFVAPLDAVFVTRMKQVGLVIPGKTNTPEFGFPCYTENEIAEPARTPWDLSRSAGGSSGGAAAAVSAGLVSAGQGSDGGGSIRIPASVTGLVGIKTSRGRITSAPMPEDVGGLPVLGPLARTVADAAALLDVLAGPSIGDAFPAAPGPASTFLAAAVEPPARLRIGRFSQPMIVDTQVHPECLAAYESASTLLADLGHEVVDTERPYGPEVMEWFKYVWTVAAATIPLAEGGENLLMPLTAHLRELGQQVSGAELANAVAYMRNVSRAAIIAMDPYDVVLTPTLAQLPARVGELRDDADPAADFQAQSEFTPFTSPFNVSGQPAMSLPFAMSESGLPIGIQIVGRPNDEATLISLAAQLEAHVRWQDRKPPIWG
jgi:amidase